MLQVPGTLTIKTISGRFGLFNVAQLELDIGRFTVKDALLEEYSEGVYHGTFAIKRIYSGSYQLGHRFTIETRAEVSQIWLDNFDERPVEIDEPMNVDPLTEERAEQHPSPLSEPLVDNSLVQTEAAIPLEPHSAELIFGDLWPLGNAVKLDPTNREQMRLQINYLKGQFLDGKRVWEFKPQEKIWIKQIDA
ncbi:MULTISPECIES: DUF3275 family protein [unclassified Shewanella]|uniref:DUF3275 family protein n=1 Tax=unclassified Shewanella TaxID=196818 RepID=UPI0015631E51|nr:DUF3275 family protein [Shewanella sp. DC2-4]NRD34611.1 DUF3275 family protein [Shewanella sp. DC2-4]GCF90522.1 hypothetical protein SMBr_27660 [Shewanella sp. M-Br]